MTTEHLGIYTLSLDENCFPLGEDSLALASFATLRPRWRVCDLGCGGGTLLLLLAQREPLSLTGVEINPEAAQCARKNLSANGLEGVIHTADLRETGLLPNEGFQLVISNPPYFAPGRGTSGGSARCGDCCSLPELCAAANRLLPTGGRFALVCRPERLSELFSALNARRLEPKRLQPLAHTPQASPSAILVEAVKNGKPGLEFLPARFHQR